jgi:hypothetical protein
MILRSRETCFSADQTAGSSTAFHPPPERSPELRSEQRSVAVCHVTMLYKAQQEQPAAQIRETYPSRDAQRGRYCPSEQLGLTFWI